MNSSYLRVILLLGAINVVVSLSITKSITRSSSFTRSSSSSSFSNPAFHLGHWFTVSKGLCPGCDHESLQFLYRHNLVRASRFEPPLMWDRKLQNYAQNWANQRKADCALRHSFSNGQFNLGENVYMGFGANWTPADAVIAWASEKRHYNYRSNTCDPGQMCGHYTQIVWKNTRKVGCARVVCNNGKIFMTCNYDPPGNYIGQKPY